MAILSDDAGFTAKGTQYRQWLLDFARSKDDREGMINAIDHMAVRHAATGDTGQPFWCWATVLTVESFAAVFTHIAAPATDPAAKHAPPERIRPAARRCPER